jgi:hypothetical protein
MLEAVIFPVAGRETVLPFATSLKTPRPVDFAFDGIVPLISRDLIAPFESLFKEDLETSSPFVVSDFNFEFDFSVSKFPVVELVTKPEFNLSSVSTIPVVGLLEIIE